MIKKLWDKYREIIMYLIFGVLATAISWGTYALFTKIVPTFTVFGITVDLTTTSNVLSWVCAFLFAFFSNKLWVFESKSWKPNVAFKEFWMFFTSRFITGIIEWFGLPLLLFIGLDQTIFGVEGMFAKVLISVIVVILNYVFSKLFIFKDKKKKA